MNKATLTEVEIISTLQHSSWLTLIVEGKDDLILLRRLEDKFSDTNLSIFPVGGRGMVLKLYSRRKEISSGKVLLFLADRDAWVHSEIPPQYVDSTLYFTDGYSIENDLFRDGKLERLLIPSEQRVFSDELKRFVRWYALALSRHFCDDTVEIKSHPSALLSDDQNYELRCRLNAGESYPEELFKKIFSDYSRYVRGKSLLSLLLRQLSASDRAAKHSAKSLLEIGAAESGIYSRRLEDWLASHLDKVTSQVKNVVNAQQHDSL